MPSVLTDNRSIDLNQGRRHISIDMDEEAVSERHVESDNRYGKMSKSPKSHV